MSDATLSGVPSGAASPLNAARRGVFAFGTGAAGERANGLVHSLGTSGTRGVEEGSEAELTVSSIVGRVQNMRRAVKAAARAVEEVALAGLQGCIPWMVTLTYAPGDEYGRRHVSDYLQCVRKWAQRHGFEVPYVWVAELQQRGAVHYHIVSWLPKRFRMPKADKQGWWRHGHTSTERARRAVGYLLKYASKGDTGAFPRGLRLFGYGGLTAAGRAVRYWLCLPGWLHVKGLAFQRITRLPGGVWLQEETGELFRSAWEFVRFDKCAQTISFRRRLDTPSISLCKTGFAAYTAIAT